MQHLEQCLKYPQSSYLCPIPILLSQPDKTETIPILLIRRAETAVKMQILPIMISKTYCRYWFQTIGSRLWRTKANSSSWMLLQSMFMQEDQLELLDNNSPLSFFLSPSRPFPFFRVPPSPFIPTPQLMGLSCKCGVENGGNGLLQRPFTMIILSLGYAFQTIGTIKIGEVEDPCLYLFPTLFLVVCKNHIPFLLQFKNIYTNLFLKVFNFYLKAIEISHLV